jgi:hypothetical protein
MAVRLPVAITNRNPLALEKTYIWNVSVQNGVMPMITEDKPANEAMGDPFLSAP